MKLNTSFCFTGSQNEVAIVTDTPQGICGSSRLKLVLISISSAPGTGNGLHALSILEQILELKCLTILSANFNRLFLAAPRPANKCNDILEHLYNFRKMG